MMEHFNNQEIFIKYADYMNQEQDLRELIRTIIKKLEHHAKEVAIILQVIHTNIEKIPEACVSSREQLNKCKATFAELAELIPENQYYRYNDHWTYTVQRLVFLSALTIYLENDTLLSREYAAELLGLKTSHKDGFHLDIEDYLTGLLQLVSELARFATNSVTLGDYERPSRISKFVTELNSGFRLLNLKNDSLRKRFDALKYDVKKIEEVVYDVSIRGLRSQQQQQQQQEKIEN